jgi:hypothetical protein
LRNSQNDQSIVSEPLTIHLPARTCAATPTLENKGNSERSEGRLAMQRVDKPCTETLTLTGSEIIDTVKQIIHEGNVRKVTVKHNGETDDRGTLDQRQHRS